MGKRERRRGIRELIARAIRMGSQGIVDRSLNCKEGARIRWIREL